MEDVDKRRINTLISAIISLNEASEIRAFLRDLLTEPELIEFGKRWQAARMLHARKPYVDIVQETGLSSTTVARVSKWLQHGKGGYQAVLNRSAEAKQR